MALRGRLLLAVAAAGAGLVIAGVIGRPGAPVPDESATWDGPPGTHHPLPASEPVRIEIPQLDVRATLITTTAGEDGEILAPPPDRPWVAGWYDHNVTPGEAGSAVIVGHLDAERGGRGREAVFYGLAWLEPGAEIRVTRRDNTIAVFTVEQIRTYEQAALPIRKVFGGPDNPAYPVLRLITCGGPYDHGTGRYRDNLVVYAKLTSVEERFRFGRSG